MQAGISAPTGAIVNSCSKYEIVAEAVAWANEFARMAVKIAEVRGPCRKRTFVRVRHLASWRLRIIHRWSFPKIALEFGGRDHATIMHGVKKINAEFGLPKNHPIDLWETESLTRLSDLEPIAEKMRQGSMIDDVAFAYGVPLHRLRQALRGAGYNTHQLAAEGRAFREQKLREEAARLKAEELLREAENRRLERQARRIAHEARAMSRSFGL